MQKISIDFENGVVIARSGVSSVQGAGSMQITTVAYEAGAIDSLLASIAALPTDDPGDGESLWNDEGTIKVASGNSTPAWLPVGAIAHFDFKNGHYFFDGLTRTLAECVEHDVNWGGFDLVSIVEGTGLVGAVVAEANSYPKFKTSVSASLLPSVGGATAVLQMAFHLGADSAGAYLAMGDVPAFNLFAAVVAHHLQESTHPEHPAISHMEGWNNRLTIGDVLVEGANKVAFTYTGTKLAASLNGVGAVVDTDPDLATYLSTATDLGLYVYRDAVDSSTVALESVTFYPPVADAVLPTLSTI